MDVGIKDTVRSFLMSSGFSIITLVSIVFFGVIIIKCTMRFIKTALLQSSIDKLIVKFFLIIIKICMSVVLLLFALAEAGFSLTGFVSAISAITLAIGLAIQDIIAGVASGMMVVTTHPFKIGDYVEIGGKGGSIQEVSLFHTIMNTPDNKRVLIPNKTVFAQDIVNFSTNDTRRLDMVYGISYDSDRKKAMDSILSFAKAHKLILKDPEPIVRIKSYDDSEIKILLRVWVRNADYWTVNFDLNREILDVYEANGLEMAYPHVVVSYEKEDK